MINKGNHSLVIDKNKVRREKFKIRDYLQTKSPNTKILGVYFDGRKEDTYFQKKKKNKMYRKLKKKEHISLVPKPGEQYMDHFMSTIGNKSEIAKSITCYLDFEQLIVLMGQRQILDGKTVLSVISRLKWAILCSGLYAYYILTNFLMDICFKI
jgi:hypothetical protein